MALGGFVATSLRERAWRAVRVGLGLGAAGLAPLLIVLLVPFAGREIVLTVMLGAATLAVVLLIVPLGRITTLRVVGAQERVDERDAVFHRFYRIEPGTPEFEAYYRAHPDKRDFDEKVRALPPLGGPGARTYHPLTAPFQMAAFQVFEEMSRELEREPSAVDGRPVEAETAELTARLKGFARYLGADLVGCARLNPAYVYSHVGRAPGTWGAPIELDHPFAVALAVEMTPEMLACAPDAPTTTETACRYFQVGGVAMVLARWIQLLGYRARAHVDGNYRVMCIPVAVDAGLGELGRLGLLITPRFGPRVRLAVVTTDLPLVPDAPLAFGVQDFCSVCLKCAVNCPSASVDRGPKRVVAGAEKWQSSQDSCYRTWRLLGSDCALCQKVCPYSHPDSPVHNLARWAIRRNRLARRLLARADDLFYGRKPGPAVRVPAWHRTPPPRPS